MSKSTKPAHGIKSGHGGGMTINGLPVVDATKALLLEITEDDIRNSNPKDPSGCTAAKAAIRQLHVAEARVHLSKVYLKQGERYIRYEAPKALRTEVVAFDRGGKFEPAEFELKPTRPSHKTKARRAYYEAQKASPEKKTESRQYLLRPPGGNEKLPKKSQYKTHGDYHDTGRKKRRHILTNVRPIAPKGFGT